MSKASVYFDLKNPSGPRDCEVIKRQLNKIPGVLSVSINKDQDRVAVDYDTTGTGPDQLRGRLNEFGFEVQTEHWQEHTM